MTCPRHALVLFLLFFSGSTHVQRFSLQYVYVPRLDMLEGAPEFGSVKDSEKGVMTWTLNSGSIQAAEHVLFSFNGEPRVDDYWETVAIFSIIAAAPLILLVLVAKANFKSVIVKRVILLVLAAFAFVVDVTIIPMLIGFMRRPWPG